MINRCYLAIVPLMFLAGCAAQTTAADATEAAIGAALEEARTVPDQPAVSEVPPARPQPQPPAPKDPEPRFDVDSENTPAKAFFMALAEGTPYNMVVHPDVKGEISLAMKDVTVREVLDVANEIYGYGYRRSRSGFVVLPATVQSRIFEVNYLNLQRQGMSRTRVSSGQASDSSSDRGSNSQAGQDYLMPASGRNRSEPQSSSRIETKYEADFWNELQSTLLQIVGNDESHQVVVNAQTGVVVVRAMPEQLRNVEKYLNAIQSVAQRQVILEAKIIEVQLNKAYQAGINWVAVAQNSNGHSYTFGQSAPPGSFPSSLDDVGGSPIVVQPGSVTNGFQNTALGSALFMAFDIGDFNAFIELLEQQGDTKVLSSPRVSTLNNQKAVIKAGSDEFFVTDIASNTVTGTSSATSRNVQLTPFFSGIALDVTPQISGDGEVILHIHPTVSEVSDQVKDLTVSGETDSLPLAFSEIRESDSIVKAKSGQIIVIGGLMRNSRRKEVFSTPVLGRIPGLGRLFRSERDIEQKTELVIMLKPIVVDNDQVWTTVADAVLDRIGGD